MLSQQEEALSLKRAAELAAIRLNVLMNQRQHWLESEGMTGTFDYQNVLSAQAKLSIAIGIIQETFVS